MAAYLRFARSRRSRFLRDRPPPTARSTPTATIPADHRGDRAAADRRRTRRRDASSSSPASGPTKRRPLRSPRADAVRAQARASARTGAGRPRSDSATPSARHARSAALAPHGRRARGARRRARRRRDQRRRRAARRADRTATASSSRASAALRAASGCSPERRDRGRAPRRRQRPAAVAAGVDRVFLMGYDYHWSGSQPGGSSPIDRSDGLYYAALVDRAVRRRRRAAGPDPAGPAAVRDELAGRAAPAATAPVIGKGAPGFRPAPPTCSSRPAFSPGATRWSSPILHRPDAAGWRVDLLRLSGNLRPKLALARDNGLAGAGFWALGYVGRAGLPDLMRDFRNGRVSRTEAPPR